MASQALDMDKMGMEVAYAKAKKSYDEGGVPIGAALVHHGLGDGGERDIVGAGHNERIQKQSPILHGEIAALENAGRLKPDVYRNSTMYTTLSPCSMCSGAILLYKIPRVVVLDDERCKMLMAQYVREKPEDWYEDIGEEER